MLVVGSQYQILHYGICLGASTASIDDADILTSLLPLSYVVSYLAVDLHAIKINRSNVCIHCKSILTRLSVCHTVLNRDKVGQNRKVPQNTPLISSIEHLTDHISDRFTIEENKNRSGEGSATSDRISVC